MFRREMVAMSCCAVLTLLVRRTEQSRPVILKAQPSASAALSMWIGQCQCRMNIVVQWHVAT